MLTHLITHLLAVLFIQIGPATYWSSYACS
jgi:hypothetical protein